MPLTETNSSKEEEDLLLLFEEIWSELWEKSNEQAKG